LVEYVEEPFSSVVSPTAERRDVRVLCGCDHAPESRSRVLTGDDSPLDPASGRPLVRAEMEGSA
jgi:hypothetical protein